MAKVFVEKLIQDGNNFSYDYGWEPYHKETVAIIGDRDIDGILPAQERRAYIAALDNPGKFFVTFENVMETRVVAVMEEEDAIRLQKE